VRILLTGRNGQVGWELERSLATVAEVVALDRAQLDLSDAAAIRRTLEQTKPDVIVNAAAYTAVDRAESEIAAADAVNAKAPGILAEQALRCGALLVHYSTDYVFDGENRVPYRENDATHPINVYGRSKLEGERAIQASGCRHLILRTSWVYAARGNNFVRTVLRLARERDELRIVGDQIGSPTAAHEIAAATATLLKQGAPADGIYHLSAAGETSWYEFALAIFSLTGPGRMKLKRITTPEYPTAATRPLYSVLSNEKIRNAAGIALPGWRVSLEEVCRALR
jgi:dTDP-4-dehydrorhamnose reductase